MRRRDFILGSTGVLVPALTRAGTPCPPPQVSVSGGGTATTNCNIVSGSSYSTNFPSSENPLSDGGKWINGKTVGIDWNNVLSVPGAAYAADYVTGYRDPIAHLNTAFTANQFAQGTVKRAAGYSPSASHEVELLLRFRITARSARGYEILWGQSGEVNVVRWNGPVGSYTPIGGTYGPNLGPAVDGDVLRAEISGNIIRVYKNGTLALTRDVSTVGSVWTDGQPGIGFFPRSGASLQSYGWKSFQAGSM